ncbi:MAG: class I SAM-dependent RNA methyltransferase, partial [Lachnospiraceae bacterium]|nr:class I SAM-dependent RNA methyltransferase [Lachnospiraceae bacterium]
MKKGMEYTGTVEKVLFPNRGIVRVEGEEESVVIKNVIPGQKVRFVVSKKRRKIEGRLLAVLAPSPMETASDPCPHFPICGGCLYQTLPYEEQLALKEGQIEELLSPLLPFREIYGGMLASPFSQEYRNKMELTFGDREPGGELTLGMHRRGSFYDVLETTDCRLMDADMRTVARVSLQFFRDKGITYYHKRTHRGYLRHLLLRKAKRTGEMLICLVTSTDHAGMTREAAEPGFAKSYGQENEEELLSDWREALLSQTYEGSIAGILHTRNDRPADVVEDQGTTVLFGKDHFQEEILGLAFTITPFSFFQTN